MEKTNKTILEKQLIVFNLGDEEYGFDINDVREIIKMVDITKVPDIENCFKGIINLRGRIIGVMDLAKKLEIASKDVDKDTRIIVVEVGSNLVGLLVNKVSEVLRVNEDKIERAPEIISKKVHEDYLKGVVIINNRLIIMLNIKHILGEKGVEQIAEIENKNK